MEYHHRKQIRLSEYDYRQNGAYYVTICTENKCKILCDIRPAQRADLEPIYQLTEIGMTVRDVIEGIPGIDKYVIMPNHIHMIIINERQQPLSSIIRIFKINTTRKLGKKIWQSRYYDHVIRDEEDYRIRWKYIDDNIPKWATDDYYE